MIFQLSVQVRERVLPMVEVDAGEGMPPLPIFTADIIEQVVERYGEEHGTPLCTHALPPHPDLFDGC